MIQERGVVVAKELPYFQFEPSEWQNGDIQMVSDKAKIAYIEICCTYWQRVASLPYAFALQKHCGGNAELMQELISCNAVKVKEDKICITFLDNQIKTIEEKSDKARKSALKRWGNANAMQTHSESNAIREDKIREDNINNTIPPKGEKHKIDFDKLLGFINLKTKRSFRIINDNVKKKYKTRLKDGYTSKDIANAIENACNSQNHKENNYQYLTPEFFSRADILDKYGASTEKDIKKEKSNRTVENPYETIYGKK